MLWQINGDDEGQKMNDWQTKEVENFCRVNNVTVIVEDEWKTREKKFILRKGSYVVIRRLYYDALLDLLPTVLLNEMLHEIPEEEE